LTRFCLTGQPDPDRFLRATYDLGEKGQPHHSIVPRDTTMK